MVFRVVCFARGYAVFFDIIPYFSYELQYFIKLKSSNQVRLYEILKQWEKRGTFDISIAALRELLDIKPKEYPLFSDFRRDVLEVCKKAINELTDITFSYELKRTGRKISNIVFDIVPKTAAQLRKLPPSPFAFLQSPEFQLTAFQSSPMSENDYPFSPADEPSEPLSRRKTAPPEPATEKIANIRNAAAPTPKSVSEKKRELEESKKHDLWYWAMHIAERNKNLKVSAERYAIGILRNWDEAGLKSAKDLIAIGLISKSDVAKRPSFEIENW